MTTGDTDKALALQAQLVELGRIDDHRAILELADDPATGPLLALLSPAARDRAELQIRLARRWADERRATNHRRLDEAKRALDGLDLELARGLLRKIDGEFLDEGAATTRDQLLLDVAARSMELEELETRTGRLIAEATPPPKKRRWFRR